MAALLKVWPRKRCALVIAALLLGWLLFAKSAAAQSSALPQEPAPSLTVLFTSNGEHTAEVAELFEAMVRARRSEVRVVLETGPAEPALPELAQAHDAAVTVFLDTRDAQRWRLALTSGSRTFRRELPGGIAQDAAIIEAAALIAARAVLSLLETPEAELPEWVRASPETPPLSPKPQASKAKKAVPAVRTNNPPNPITAFLGVAANASLYAPQTPLQAGATLFGGAEFSNTEWPLDLLFSLGVGTIPALTVATDWGSFELQRYPAEGRAGFRVGSAALSAVAGLGFILELQQRSRGRAERFVATTAPQSTVTWGLAPFLGAAWRPAAPWELALLASADVAPPSTYVAGDAERSPLLTPYALRPRAELSLSYHFGAAR